MQLHKAMGANLKLKYRKTLELALVISLIFHIGLLRTIPEIKISPKKVKIHSFRIKVEDIPQTEQAFHPPRSRLPVATESQAIPTDVTIASTDLQPPIEAGYVFVPYDQPPVPVGGLAVIKKILKYPELALKGGIEGVVVLGVLVSEEGDVIKTEILKDSGLQVGFEKAAQEAMMKVKWEPAMQRDRPVKIWVSIPIHFKLE